MPAEHEAFDHLMLTLASDTDSSQAPPPQHYDATLAWEDELFCAGRVVVFTDGACTNNQDSRLRRAGYGAFWARDHPLNFGQALAGPVQTNQRAELQAVLKVLDLEKRPLEIRTDSRYVLNGCRFRRHLWRSQGWRLVEHGDLWELVDAHLLGRAPDAVTVVKVKGHATWLQVRRHLVTRVDKIGNDAADCLATRGASLHAMDAETVERMQNATRLAREVQEMMVDIILARAKSSPDTVLADDGAPEGPSTDDEHVFFNTTTGTCDSSCADAGGETIVVSDTSSEDEAVICMPLTAHGLHPNPLVSRWHDPG